MLARDELPAANDASNTAAMAEISAGINQ